MNIDIEKVDTTTIVIPRGDIDMSQSRKLREVLKEVLDSSNGKMVVDLTEVNYMDSSGLANLQTTYEAFCYLWIERRSKVCY